MPLLWDTLSNSCETLLLRFCHVSCHILKRDVKHFCIVPDVPVTKTLCVNLSPRTGGSDLFTVSNQTEEEAKPKLQNGPFLPHLQKWLALLPPQRRLYARLHQSASDHKHTSKFHGFSMSKSLKKWLSFVTVMKKYYIWTFNLAFGIVHVTAAKHFCVKSRSRWWGNERETMLFMGTMWYWSACVLPWTNDFSPWLIWCSYIIRKNCRKRGLSRKHDLTSESWIQNCAGPQYKD